MAGEVTEEDEETGLLLSASSSSVYELPLTQLYAKFRTDIQTGLKLNHAERQQMRVETGANVVPPPVDCPLWLCCLLPCLLKTKKMKYFNTLQERAVDVYLENRYVKTDPTGLLKGDIIKIEAGMHVPADIRILEIQDAPCMFDTRAITGETNSYSEREGVGTLSTSVHCSGGDSFSFIQDNSSNYYEKFHHVNNLNIAFTGFLCTRGSCVGLVVATGSETLLAKMIKRKKWPPQ